MNMSEPLRARLLRNIQAAVDCRESAQPARLHQGQVPMKIAVCLGPGRCMITQSGAEGAPSCAFCAIYPDGPSSYKEVEAFAKKVIAGN